jgi:hypothetical protein
MAGAKQEISWLAFQLLVASATMKLFAVCLGFAGVSYDSAIDNTGWAYGGPAPTHLDPSGRFPLQLHCGHTDSRWNFVHLKSARSVPFPLYYIPLSLRILLC